MEEFEKLHNGVLNVQIAPGNVFMIPTKAVPHSPKYDEAIDSDSDCEDAGGLETKEEFTKESIRKTLEEHRLDIDGRELPLHNTFHTLPETAGAFTPMVFNGRAHEVPCIALWDYFGGHTCMDLNVVAGDIVHVVAEEYQVRRYNPTQYLRIPLQWSLASVKSTVSPGQMGLIPSSWIVSKKFFDENQALYLDSWWCLGVCKIEHAMTYLTQDLPAQQEGLFVIFSPSWLNIDPSDYRPYILLMQCDRGKVMQDKYREEGEGQFITESFPFFRRETDESRQPKTRDEIDEKMEPDLEAERNEKRKTRTKGTNQYRRMPTEGAANLRSRLSRVDLGQGPECQASEWVTRTRPSSVLGNPIPPPTKATLGKKRVDIDRLANYTNSNLVTRAFTITRSYLGDYELFGLRYTTLYDLVYHLANNQTELPHKLIYGTFTNQPNFPYIGVPAPRDQPVREVEALPMFCEQWAARHYSQVTEPANLSSPFSFVTRTILNPLKNLHAQFIQFSGMSATDEQEAASVVAPIAAAKNSNQKKTVNQLSEDILPDESSLVALDDRLLIKKNELSYNVADSLGKGEFGAVYRGILKRKNESTGVETEVECAIKCQKLLRTDKDAKLAWLGEMETMTLTCHPNVIAFLGYRLGEDHSALLVFELASLGALDHFCKNLENDLTDNEVIDFLMQIARGMGHLHTREPCVVHGDLAARNVLVHHHYMDTTRQILKITDLGLAKSVRPETHTSYDDPNKIPFKWLPPEVLKGRELTWTSDVWSYGMVAHELYGIGEPYGMIGAEKVVHMVADGHRFDRQPKMPHYIYEIVLQCQRRVPHDRPSMREVELQLQEHLIENELDHRKKIHKRFLLENNMKAAAVDW